MDLFTSKTYNSHFNWEKIQRHLQGIWHNSNTSLDIITLHNEIMNLKNTALLSFDAKHNADKINHGFKYLYLSSFKNGLDSLIILALLDLGILLFLPIVKKLALNNFSMLAAKIHDLKLKQAGSQ